MMKLNKKHIALGIALACLLSLSPLAANAGNVGWNVSVGGGYGGGYGYGGGWRPAAYGPGWGRGYGYGAYGGGWRGNWVGAGYYGYPQAAYYAPPVAYAPPVVAYVAPPQPMVLASQPQPAVWYFCEATGNYYPYVQECASGWKTQPATPPTSSVTAKRPQY
jgi:hypothetical protein